MSSLFFSYSHKDEALRDRVEVSDYGLVVGMHCGLRGC